MGRLPVAAVLLLLLLLPAVAPAEPRVDAAPEWRKGDRWEYQITIQSPLGTTYGNLSQEVSAVGSVRIGNRSADAYTLNARQTSMGFGTNSSVSSTIYVSRSDLCTLYVNSTGYTYYADLKSKAHSEARYNASDGRYRFPLAAGANWSFTYELNRTVYMDGGALVENRTVYGQSTCEGVEKLNLSAGRFLTYRITCTYDSGNRTTYWYSDSVRGEVRREEVDRRTGTLTIHTLRKYERAPEPFPLLGTDSGRALFLGIISAALLIVAAALLLARRRTPKPLPQKDVKEEAPTSFHFEKTREGLQMKLNTINLACPACRRVFKVAAGTRMVKCPYCGKEGRLR